MKQAQRKLLVQVGAVLGGVGLLFLVLIMPVNGYRQDLDEEIRQADSQKLNMLVLEQSFHQAEAAAKAASQRAGARDPNFTLFGFLENLAAKDNVRSTIEFIKPSVKKLPEGGQQEVVDLRLSNVSLEKLTTYLYHIEASPENVRIERFVLRTHDDRGLDVDLVLSAFTRAQRG